MINGFNSIKQNISEYLSAPPRKNTKRIRYFNSSYLITAFLLLVLILIITFISLIFVEYSHNHSLTIFNESLNNKLRELKSDISSIDSKIAQLTEENEQLATLNKNIKNKGTELQNEDSVIHQTIKEKKIHFHQLKGMIDSSNDSITVSQSKSLRLDEQLKDSTIRKEALSNRIKELETKMKERKANFRSEQSESYSSEILRSKTQINLLNQWVDPNQNKKITYHLLYRGSRDSFSSNSFHLKCDDDSIKNTLVLIRLADNQIIGGYTQNNWNSYNSPELIKKDRNSFIFNLGNKIKYDVLNFFNQAIICNKQFGPCFGFGDLFVTGTKINSSFPKSYGKGSKKNELTNGIEYIDIKELEVFTLTFSWIGQ